MPNDINANLQSIARTQTKSEKLKSDAMLGNLQNEEMGQKEFLQLFTAQLQNQNPLDPMENEAFVAQLAQFSQLEATVSMADGLKSFTDTLKSDRMLNGASLIGKKISPPDGYANLQDGKNVSGVISIPNGADSIELAVYDKSGNKIHEAKTGRKSPGEVTVEWDGTDSSKNRLPEGEYRIIATVNSLGEGVQIPITTPQTIQSVTYSSEDADLILQLSGGSTVRLSNVSRIEG